MAEVRWTKPALDDLEDINEYISRDSKVYAERFASGAGPSRPFIKKETHKIMAIPLSLSLCLLFALCSMFTPRNLKTISLGESYSAWAPKRSFTDLQMDVPLFPNKTSLLRNLIQS